MDSPDNTIIPPRLSSIGSSHRAFFMASDARKFIFMTSPWKDSLFDKITKRAVCFPNSSKNHAPDSGNSCDELTFGHPLDIVKYDNYEDFVKSFSRDEEYDRRRLITWNTLLAGGGSTGLLKIHRTRSLLESEGVPIRFRWKVWREVIGNKRSNDALYTEKRSRNLESNIGWSRRGSVDDVTKSPRSPHTQKEVLIEEIRRDLYRTFPSSAFYSVPENIEKLGNIMATYSLSHSTGYCQGMTFLAGTLLQISHSEPSSYSMLSDILHRYNLQSLFSDKLPLLSLLKHQFVGLLKSQLPEVHTFLESHNVFPDMYIVRWLFSLYALPLRLKVVVEVWDFLFAACPPNQLHTGFQRAVLIVGLAIIKLIKREVLRLNSTESIIVEMNGKGIAGYSAAHILNVARKIDKDVPQAIFEASRSEWAIKNPEENNLVVQGELSAIGSN